jgi:hypothetical protein
MVFKVETIGNGYSEKCPPASTYLRAGTTGRYHYTQLHSNVLNKAAKMKKK